jgi:hypothetical protein
MSWLDDVSAIRAKGPALWDALSSVVERHVEEFNESTSSDSQRTVTFQRSLPHGLVINSPYFSRQLCVWLDIDKHAVLFMVARAKEFVGTFHIRARPDGELYLLKENRVLTLDDASHLLLKLVLTETARGQAS